MWLHPCKAKRISKMNLPGNRPILEIHAAAGNINPSKASTGNFCKNPLQKEEKGQLQEGNF